MRIDRRGWLLAIGSFSLLVAGGWLLLLPAFRPASATEGNYRCRVMEVPGGYGYVVTVLPAGDTLIVQPYMPAIGGYFPFGRQEEALETGRLVCRKLAQGEAPTVSREEVRKIVEEGK